jgi:hypothetical protein
MSDPGMIVQFDYDTFTTMFLELNGVTEPAATAYWTTATTLINNWRSPFRSLQKLTQVLYYTTAHVAVLFSQQTESAPTTGGSEPPTPLVGRISNATEGSVTVAAEMPTQPASAAWWNQTQYGALVWVMTQTTRQFRSIVGPRRYFGAIYPSWGG